MDQIESMVTSPTFVLRDAVIKGFAALDQNFANKILSILCTNPCENPFHEHTKRDRARHLHDQLQQRVRALV